MVAYILTGKIGKGDAAVVHVDPDWGISVVEPLILQGVDWSSCALLALDVMVLHQCGANSAWTVLKDPFLTPSTIAEHRHSVML